MDAGRIADLVRRGTGAAARIVGYPYDVHRPQGPGVPVRAATLRLQLPAHFMSPTRQVTFARAPSPTAGGLGSYGGLVRQATIPLLTGWPASVIEGGRGIDRAGLPQDVPLIGWSVLLPSTPGIILQTGDLMTDDLGRAGVVGAAELSEHGWSLSVRQAAT